MRRLVKILGVLLLATVLLAISVPLLANGDPDLQPTSIGVTTLYAGITNKVAVTVINNTDVPVPNFDVKLQADGVDVATITGNSILGNQDQNYWPKIVNFEWTPAAAGNPTLTVIVDSAGAVNETDENNNHIQQAVSVIDLAPVTVNVRVEGQNSTIWSGQVTFQSSNITDKQGDTYPVDRPTALGALDAAAQAGGFNYVVDSGWGPLAFVEEVAGETNVGFDGWQFRVNWLSPSVAAVDHSIGDGDSVLWYYGSWMSQPLRLTVDNTDITTAEDFTTTVEAFDGAAWSPLEGATLYVDSQQHTTDANGQVVDISLAGSYQVYAAKGTWAEYVRSNRVTVNVGGVSGMPGDANGDGAVNALDITKVERLIAGLD